MWLQTSFRKFRFFRRPPILPGKPDESEIIRRIFTLEAVVSGSDTVASIMEKVCSRPSESR
jgi:hypothetical protein